MAKRAFFISTLTSCFAFGIGLFVCFLLTPLFWKLETVLNVELAGHSGPAGWLLAIFGGLFAILGFALTFKRLK